MTQPFAGYGTPYVGNGVGAAMRPLPPTGVGASAPPPPPSMGQGPPTVPPPTPPGQAPPPPMAPGYGQTNPAGTGFSPTAAGNSLAGGGVTFSPNQNPGGVTGAVNSVGGLVMKQYGNDFVADYTGQNGIYGTNITQPQAWQKANEKYSIANDVNYGNYTALGTTAQQAALYGQNALNDPNAAAALAAQQRQAGGPSNQQVNALGAQNNSLGILQSAAMGNGPTAADIQGQQSISQAMRAQLSAGASARGGAYQQAAAQQQAGVNAAGVQAQGAGQAAALRAQEQQAAQAQFAQASGQAVQGANAAYASQQQALAGATGAAQSEQGMGLNYYNQLANLYQGQSSTAANLASNQVANDYGLAGTAMQTGTQQNIANQQSNQQWATAGIGAGAGLLMALASTGGAESAARGAREGGATPEEAAGIGQDVGQRLGELRMGPAAVRFAPADAEAARRGAGFPTANALPGPASEPQAAAAFNAGLEAAHVRHALEHLAKLRGGRRGGG